MSQCSVETIQTRCGGLQFELAWPEKSSRPHPFGSTFGRLRLVIGGEPVWYGEPSSEGTEGLWIELVEFLGRYWRFILWEEGYPFFLSPSRPSEFRDELEERWSEHGFKREQVDEEEEQAFRFCCIHNLAECSPGTIRPDVWMIRDGRTFIVEAALEPNPVMVHVDADDFVKTLTQLAETVLSRSSALVNERTQSALQRWSRRDEINLTEQVALNLRWKTDRVSEFCGPDEVASLFSDPLGSGVGTNLYLSLAYRCKGLVPDAPLKQLLAAVRAMPDGDISTFQSLSQAIQSELEQQFEYAAPYVQGRRAAVAFRAKLGASPGKIDPERVLIGYGVQVTPINLETLWIDGAAIWKHGRSAAVFWNQTEKLTQNAGAQRATIAHELCHLLLDREGALSLAAVVNGVTDRRREQRANAFAAEFLCPLSEAGALWDVLKNSASAASAFSPSVVVKRLVSDFQVSRQLATLQLANSGINFTRQEQSQLEQLGPGEAHYPWSNR